MAIRDKLEKNVQPHLEPGETVQAAFPATGGLSPWFLVLTYLFFFLMKYVIVVATDRRILLLKASILGTTKPKEVLGTFPRETKLGPVSGIYAKINLGGTTYYVHRRFHGEVKAADAAGGASSESTPT
ncbi:MAG: hypothetical protein M3540_11815 [Actinomycetota bacterium]|nr:hypothetical protein [Actinomycetota bacterium]